VLTRSVARRVIVVEPPLPPPPEDHPFRHTLSAVSPDLWTMIARCALAADGDSVQTWLRLSLVNRTFRNATAGDVRMP